MCRSQGDGDIVRDTLAATERTETENEGKSITLAPPPISMPAAPPTATTTSKAAEGLRASVSVQGHVFVSDNDVKGRNIYEIGTRRFSSGVRRSLP